MGIKLVPPGNEKHIPPKRHFWVDVFFLFPFGGICDVSSLVGNQQKQIADQRFRVRLL